MTTYVTENYLENGGNRLIVRGTIDREDAPVLPVETLQAAILQHYHTVPDAVSATAVHAAENLAAVGFSTTLNITNPDVPRNITVKGNVAGVVGNVEITGTNFLDEEITETIALNGANEVAGVKAFKTVTMYELPVRSHVPVAQVETAVAVGEITVAGIVTCTVTATGLAGSPLTVNTTVALGDTAAVWAGKVRAQLTTTAAITALFTVSGADENIILTRKVPAANDATLNIALADGTSTGVTEDATSNDTTAGVPYDTVSVGIGGIVGLPHTILAAACMTLSLFNLAADAGTTVAHADLENNTYDSAGALDGTTPLDLYYLV